MFPASTHSFFMVGLLRAMGVHAEPFLIRTLCGSCGLSSLQDEVQTLPFAEHPPLGGACSLSSLRDEVRALPGSWAHSRLLGTLPRVVPVVSAPSEMRCSQSPVDAHTPQTGEWPGGEQTGAVAAGEFPKVPQRVFFFWGKILLLSSVAPCV